MDIETADALDTLTGNIRRVETSLTGAINRVETSLTGQVNRVETSLTSRIEDLKRHADIRFESVHDDIRMLAEGIASLATKVDSLRR